MDRRTIFLQQLVGVSDFLTMQRNMLKGLCGLAHGIMGGNTVVMTSPANTTPGQPTDALPSFAALVLTVPSLYIYQLAALDAAWSTLGVDNTPFLMQGFNPGGTNFNITPPGAGLSQFFLIEAQLAASSDETPVVLPYFAQIQTTTLASSTTSKIYVSSNQGMADGDQIVVQGFSASGGVPVFISGAPSSDGGGDFINISPSLTSAPGAGVTVRDTNPNNGNPLAGPGNSGVAQNIDRIRRVSLQVKAGTAAASPTQPTATAGWIPLYMIGPVPNGASTLSGLIAKAPDAPFWPGLSGRSHHGGVAGQANKINVDAELSEDLVKVAGDVMTGDLVLPHLEVVEGQIRFNGKFGTVWTNGGSSAGLPHGLYKIDYPSVPSFDDSLVILAPQAVRYLKPGNTFDQLPPFARIASGDYVGTGTAGRTFNLGFTPYLLLIIPSQDPDLALPENALWVSGTSVHDIVIRTNFLVTSPLNTIAIQPTFFSGYQPIIPDGFTTHPSVPSFNQLNVSYRYLALG